MGRPIPSENSIVAYFHCGKCLLEVPAGMSASAYQRIEAGYTEIGLQVRCRRHDENLLHIDFAGQKFAANTK